MESLFIVRGFGSPTAESPFVPLENENLVKNPEELRISCHHDDIHLHGGHPTILTDAISNGVSFRPEFDVILIE